MDWKEFIRPTWWKLGTTAIILAITFTVYIIGTFNTIGPFHTAGIFPAYIQIPLNVLNLPFYLITSSFNIIEKFIDVKDIILGLFQVSGLILILPYHYVLACLFTKAIGKTD